MDHKCKECEKAEPQVRLQKCRTCFAHFCEEHAFSRSGISFCSGGCADEFFFSDPDDE